MAFGVETTGFVEKTLQDIQDGIRDRLRAKLGASINVGPDSVLGQLIDVFSDEIAENWELGGDIYSALYPDSADGASLDNVSAITGTLRLSATKTAVLLLLDLDAGTTVPLGSVVSISGTGDRFVTLAAAANLGSDPANIAVNGEAEQTGPVEANAFAIDSIETPVAGWTAQAAITAGTAELYALSDGQTLTVKVDNGAEQTATFNTADFVDIGNATAAEVVLVIRTDIAGATAFDAGGFPRIESNTDGIGSAIEVTGGTANGALGFSTTKIQGMNQADETLLGMNTEEDPAFRIRREILLRAAGSATLEAILADVLAITGVVEAVVIENVTDATDANGLPPHSFAVIVDAPTVTDLDIATAIFLSKAAGIATFGTSSAAVTDTQGISHTINFLRAPLVPIFIEITVVTNTDPLLGPIYPTDGDTQVKNALVKQGELLGIGDDVIAERIKCAAFDVDGVTDITVFLIGLSASPTLGDNIPIGFASLTDFDTADIVVTS